MGNPYYEYSGVPEPKIPSKEIEVISREIKVINPTNTDLVNKTNKDISVRKSSWKTNQNLVKKTKTKEIIISGKKCVVDAEQLIRMVKQVCQSIGEHKNFDNAYANYIVPALRKSRSDIVSDLEHHFGIHWKLDNEGNSVFY